MVASPTGVTLFTASPHSQEEEELVLLAQETAAPFAWQDKGFQHVKHFLMWKRALLFDEVEIADEALWARNARGFALEANLAKFRQQADARQVLLATKSDLLGNASVTNLLWGTGLPISAPTAHDVTTWRGQNLLGEVLMDVRKLVR